MRSQFFAALCFAALIAAGLTLGLIGAESHADGDGSATPTASEFAISDYIPAGPSGMEPNEDELFPLRRGQQQVAILEALQGKQQRVGGLALGLHLLSLAEERLRLGPAAQLV